MSTRPRSVALVSMPSLSARFPSFQVALLKSTLEEAAITVQPLSLFMYFGTFIGWRLNEVIADVWPCLVGEWIWSKAAFGSACQENDDQYFERYEGVFEAICRQAGCSLDDIRRVRDEHAPAFIDFCVNAIDWSRFGLLGFTVVFQQLLSTLALARALKQRYPDLPIILGGASLEDDIADEVMRHCPQVDYAHCGDAEQSFPEMIRRMYAGESMEGLRGIMWRDQNEIRYAGRSANFADMNATPLPDFDEYFYARREGGYEKYGDAREVLLPIEAARGCWWGEKNHCTFCGLNRSGMEFRSKSAGHVIEQLQALARRHRVFRFNAIDNIMPPAYTHELFGRLATLKSDIELHYEVRPNLSRAQLGRMRRGGLYSVQPGIESLSTHILKLMKKNSTGMRNVEFIKWCTYFGIDNLYNILVRFPGETSADYRIQSEIIPKLIHFQAPYAIAKARADRGSPMYSDPASQNIVRLSPADCYRFIFPEGVFDLARVSYYFDHEMVNTVPDDYDDVFSKVAEWQHCWRQESRPYLRYRKACTTIQIEDGRVSPPEIWQYEHEQAALYEYCADARSIKQIKTQFRSRVWVDDALEEFVKKDLMLYLDDRYLSLALPVNANFDLEFSTETPLAPTSLQPELLVSLK